MLYILGFSLLFVLNHGADPRIVGGLKADYSDYPYIVSIYEDGYLHSCGGSLITDPSDDNPIVLTAAHCTDGINLNFVDYYVDIGREKVTSDYYDGQLQNYDTIKVIAISQHPNYDDSTTEADIALLQLERAVDSSINAEMVSWDVSTSLEPNDWLTVIGYGRNESGGKFSPTLEYVNQSYINNTICDAYFYLYENYESTTDWANPDFSLAAGETSGLIYDDMMCAHAVNKDSCQGDSGGPLIIPGVTNDYTDDIQVGIVSWGYGCAAGTPGVYASVAYYRTWINNCIDYLGGDDQYEEQCGDSSTTTTPAPTPDSTCQTFTLCNTYTTSPLEIDHTTPISSVLTFSTSGEFVTMTVSIDGNHTWMADLLIELTGPNDDSITLLNNTGGSRNGFTMTFTDSGSTIHDRIDFISGNSYRPQGGTFYSVFGGIDVDGDWTLSIIDSASGDSGYLTEFCISEVCIVDDGAAYTLKYSISVVLMIIINIIFVMSM